jgi:hypothetical protein
VETARTFWIKVGSTHLTSRRLANSAKAQFCTSLQSSLYQLNSRTSILYTSRLILYHTLTPVELYQDTSPKGRRLLLPADQHYNVTLTQENTTRQSRKPVLPRCLMALRPSMASALNSCSTSCKTPLVPIRHARKHCRLTFS